MEQLIVTARNIRLLMVEEDGKFSFEPEIEAVLTLMERQVRLIGAGFTNVEETKTVRFTMNPRSARAFAQRLEEWADEAEDKAEQLNLKIDEIPDDPPPTS